MISLAVNAALAFYGAVFFSSLTASPPADPYTRALSFALSGDERMLVRPVDWNACVFEVNSAVIRVGALDRSRLAFAVTETKTGWGPVRRVTVGLHGDGPVYERTELGLEEEGPWDDEAVRMLKRAVRERNPELFATRKVVASDYTLTLATTDLDRVREDWATLLRGCTTRHGVN
ncbi:hypothetical protein [Rhodoplanes roseus]|uniref:Uncharacterized protein n=1 Tax=Rhodoplanes roseus TaxID=29409 RepID=A0A327KIY7_9BRAD|nr:hypothetical protein [Rhodoplanes roseus]RAI38081.1 hypothetical protein CH341_28505 [Rhodoplanes roseus]